MCFYNTGLEELRLPRSLVKIGKNALNSKNLIVYLPDKMEKIRQNWLNESGIRSVFIPKSVIEIEPGAFYNTGSCDLQEVTFERDSKLRKIGVYAFRRTSITSF